MSWPEYLLARIDAYAEAHHETRSGLLAKAAERYLSEQRAHERIDLNQTPGPIEVNSMSFRNFP